jgi:hypothetical protein
VRRERWPTEAAMFEAFLAVVEPQGLVGYPECCGHDLLLEVSPRWTDTESNLRVGDTIVVEGKLQATLHLLHQARPRRAHGPWADWYAILVGRTTDRETRELCRDLQIVVIDYPPAAQRHTSRFPWQLPVFPASHRLEVTRRFKPLLKVDMAPGQPAPRTVTPWKVEAVRLCLRLAGGEELRATDFRAVRIDARRFVEAGWMVQVRREGRVAVYRGCETATRPDLRYPEIVAALAAEGESCGPSPRAEPSQP